MPPKNKSKEGEFSEAVVFAMTRGDFLPAHRALAPALKLSKYPTPASIQVDYDNMLRYYTAKEIHEVTALDDGKGGKWMYVSIMGDSLSEAVTFDLQGNIASGFTIVNIEWGRP